MKFGKKYASEAAEEKAESKGAMAIGMMTGPPKKKGGGFVPFKKRPK